LPSSGLVEFYKSDKTAPEEFSLFCKISTRGFNPFEKVWKGIIFGWEKNIYYFGGEFQPNDFCWC
jgi:hypothetical protein